MRAQRLILVVLLVAACGPATGTTAGSGSPTASVEPSNAANVTASPSAPPSPTPAGAPKLECTSRPAPGDPLVLVSRGYAPPGAGELLVMDAVSRAAPTLDCLLSPAAGGRFVSSTLIAFWLGSSLFTADIGSGAIVLASNLPVAPTQGAFSSDGSRFAYRVGDDTGGLSDHLFVAGRDLTLITRPGIGGHGGPPYGPYDELAFSADAQYLLTDDSFGANFPSGPPNFVVYDMSGKTVFQSGTAAFGEWAPHGDKLYFLAESQAHGIAGDLHSWDPV